MKAKIKIGVRPFGGRTFPVLEQKRYPNGREVVVVNVGQKKLTLAHYAPDAREYNLREVDLLPNA